VLCFATCSSAELPDAVTSCDADEGVSSRGRQLIQRAPIKKRLGQQKALLTETERAICSLEQAREAPLTDDGFQSVAETCCFDDMKEYIRRAATDLGKQVCDEGGISGIAPFFSCPQKTMSYTDLKNALESATAAGGSSCPWLGAIGAECTTLASSCGVSINPTTQPALFKGFVGLQAVSNPSALVTTPAVKDSIRSKLATAISVPQDAIVVTMGTGPFSEVSLLSLERCSTCTVYASYSVVQTDPPTLDEAAVATSISSMDTAQLETDISTEIEKVAPEVGALKITKFRSCKEGGTCEEKTLREDLTSDDPVAANGPFEACKNAGPYPAKCAVFMGAGSEAKASTCKVVGYTSYSCDIGQEPSCKGKASGDACTFGDIEGVCATENPIGETTEVTSYCNIWPISFTPSTMPPSSTPKPTPPPPANGPFEACKTAGPYPVACTVYMGEDMEAKASTCGPSGYESYSCSIGQWTHCENKAPGDTCTFEGIKGACANKNPIGEPRDVNIYCNIWPLPSATNDVFGQCPSHLDGGVVGQYCSAFMGAGVPAKEGTCKEHGAHFFTCEVGQRAACSAHEHQSIGDPCNLEGHQGTCDVKYISQAYCNIWPISGTPTTNSSA